MEANNRNNEIKNDLIKEEITNKNDKESDFTNYCLSKNKDGDKIENNKNENEKKDEIEMNKEKEKEKEEMIKGNKNSERENSNNKSIKRKKEKIIKCNQLEKTNLNDNDITVNLVSPKEINGGMFSKNYILYTVETQPFGWRVHRRYNDFSSLRKSLIKYFPFHKVEPLPNQSKKCKQFTKEYMYKKMNKLNIFMNNIIENETFKASDILESFLAMDNRARLENKFKEINNQIIENENVEDYKTLSGEAIILHAENCDDYFKHIYNYLNLQNDIFVKLNQNLKKFYDNTSEINDNMNEIISNFGALYKINKNAVMKDIITNTYGELQKLFKVWKKVYIKQCDIVKNRLKHFFEYINLNNYAYKEILVKRKEVSDKFINESTKLKLKKERLFSLKDISKFEIERDTSIDSQRLLNDRKYAFSKMCATETKNLNKLYKIAGYGNKMSMNQIKQMIRENSIYFLDNFQKFREEFDLTVNEYGDTWTKFDSFIKDMYRKYKNYNRNKTMECISVKNIDNDNSNKIDTK